ncbi:MAG: ABC transporter permease [Bacilli bacterium]|nr:ABC transporter permease [Bacilli bacterium]
MDKRWFFGYIARRLVFLLITLFCIFTFCFFLIHLLPGANAAGVGQDEAIFRIRQEAYGYDQPILIQYFLFFKNLFYPFVSDGNGKVYAISPWGYSTVIEKGATPESLLAEGLTPTVLVNTYAIIIAIPLGIVLGIALALNRSRFVKGLSTILIVVFIALPSFAYAFFFQYLFGFRWHILPTDMSLSGFQTNDIRGVNWFDPSIQKALVLPVLSLIVPTVAGFARVSEAEVNEAIHSPFMLSSRAKGMGEFEAVFAHGLRNAMVPIFPMILGQLIGVLSGSIIIESVFRIPGVGGLYIKSLNIGGEHPDYAVFLFLSIFYAFIGLLGSLIIDLGYTLIDPRMRVGSAKGDK